jgi:DNA polymerase beta
MEIHEQFLSDTMQSSEDYHLAVVGSYRRGSESSGDIDVLIRIPSCISSKDAITVFHRYIDSLVMVGYIQEILAKGDHKCMAICRLGKGRARRLDLLLTPDAEYSYALLYFTGSDRFNVAFRQHALDKGFTLNEKGLVELKRERGGVGVGLKPRIKRAIPYMESEKDIFEFLGLRYIKPSQRIDARQIIPSLEE